MKTITKQYNVYTFAELSDEVKQAVIDRYYENLEYPFLSQDINERLPEIDTKGVFSNFDVTYSLGYSQGDGLSFSADFDIEKFLDSYDFQNFKKRALAQQYFISVKNNGRYAYASKSCVRWEENCASRYMLSDLARLGELFDSIYADIVNYYLQVCSEAKKYGYELLEYRASFEEFADFQADTRYLENGDEFFV